MATTKKQQREWIRELVQLKAEQARITDRRAQIATAMGPGTYRSTEYPGLKVTVTRGSSGWTTSWKHVAEDMARRFNTTVDRFTVGHRKRTHRGITVTVAADKAKRVNLPKVAA